MYSNPWSLTALTSSLFVAGGLLLAAPGAHADPHHVLARMVDQADLRGAPTPADARARLHEVAARRDADRDPRGVVATLGRLGAAGHVTRVECFWLVNACAFAAEPEVVEVIAALPEVAEVADYPRALHDEDADGGAPDAPLVDWGLGAIGAADAWAAGVDGTGVRVGVIDSGVYAEHPAIAGKLATLPSGAPAFFNGSSTGSPSDDPLYSHGTHVTGIVLGGTATGEAPGAVNPDMHIGVAPGATYVFAKSGAPVSSMQWMADPDGDPATDDQPLVVNNSWISFEPALYPFIDALEALGTTVVFSAGNSGGGGAYSVRGVHNYPSLLLVGNTKESGEINGGSSQGPGVFLGEAFTKPDVSAPGTGILSSVVPGAYDGALPNPSSGTAIYKMLSGTSMAAPMVTGVIALLQQARAEAGLTPLSPGKVKSVLQITATDMGAPGKDTTSGSGLVDVMAALALALDHVPVTGVVLNSAGEPVPFATIDLTIEEVAFQLYSGADGVFDLALPPGQAKLELGKLGHASVLVYADLPDLAPVPAQIVLASEPNVPVASPNLIELHVAAGGATSEPFALANHGHAPMVVEAITSSDPAFEVFTAMPLTIEPYADTIVGVAFSPTESALYVGELTVHFAGQAEVVADVLGFGSSSQFVDVAVAAGVDNSVQDPDWTGGTYADSVWADLNGDGWDDLLVAGNGWNVQPSGKLVAFNAGDGTFLQPTDVAGLETLLSSSDTPRTVLAADMDDDGDQDIVETDWVAARVHLNDGTGQFSLGATIPMGGLVTIADFDGDGRLDLAGVSSSDDELRVALQTGPLTFAIETWLALDFDEWSTEPFALDFDHDGRMDLVTRPRANTKPPEPGVTLYRNLGDAFELVQHLPDLPSVDLAFCDLDDDGDTDMYVQSRSPQDPDGYALDFLFVNEHQASPDVPFVATPSPFDPPSYTHNRAAAITCADFDNDGRRDLYFGYSWKGYNRLFRQLEGGDFEEVAKLVGIHGGTKSPDLSANWADFDRDGDLDAYVTRQSKHSQLYRNELEATEAPGGALSVRLVGTESNRDGLGAAVTVYTTSGARSETRLPSRQSFGQTTAAMHFGLGALPASQVCSVGVEWPSGQSTNAPVVSGHGELVLVEGVEMGGVGSGDADADGDVDADDVACAQLAAVMAPAVPACLASAALFDLDCDGVIGTTDVQGVILVANQGALPAAMDADGDGLSDGCVAAIGCTAEVPAQPIVFGDVNESGYVNVVDVQCTILMAASVLSGTELPACASAPMNGDMDCNGTFNVIDAQLVIRKALDCWGPAATCVAPLNPLIDYDQDGIHDACE